MSCHRRKRGPRRKASHVDHPHCLRGGRGPAGSGLVASLARPGGNTTGLSIGVRRCRQAARTAPGTSSRSASIGNHRQCRQSRRRAGNSRGSGGARTLGSMSTCSKSGAPTISQRPSRRSRAGSQALYVCADPLVNANHARINTLALGARLPTFYAIATMSKRAVSCPMAQARCTCSDAPPTMSIRFCTGRSRATCRSSSRPSSISSST